VHHGEGLRRLLTATKTPADEQDALIAALETDISRAAVSPADSAMLAYVSKLTRTPEDMEAADVESLRDHGFDDRAIHDICAVAAYYAFVNRIADGLGVGLEARW
jgi:uncharacterized peroxidase-related enzyme